MKKTTLYTMNKVELAERAATKALHSAVRAQIHNPVLGGPSRRYALIAWGFARGFPYRRIERTCREHNEPSVIDLARALAPFFSEIAADTPSALWAVVASDSPTGARLQAWLTDPIGAIPVTVLRVKGRYEQLAAEIFRELQVAE